MTFSTNQVAQAAQVSLRQLQWWDERGLVDVVHQGHRRMYDEEDAFKVLLVGKLRSKGLSLQRIRKVLRSINPGHLMENPRATIMIRLAPLGTRTRIRWEILYDEAGLISKLDKESGPVIVVSVGPLLTAMRRKSN